MSEIREALLRRVANALIGLEQLSDGKTARIDPNRVHGGEDAGISVLRDKSPFEFHASELVSWCEKSEARAATEKKRVAEPMTKLQEDYWFQQYEGADYRTVANKENLEPLDVWRRRERMGLNPQNGKPLEKAA